jgi:hypothetical protein
MESTKYTVRPRLGKIPTASSYSGLGRTTLYGLAEQYQGLFKKYGAATLVDFDILDQILDQLPDAAINVSTAKVLEDQADCEVAEASDRDSKEAPDPK